MGLFGADMVYRVNGTMKDGRLVLEPPQFLPAGERLASLAMEPTEAELIPLSTPFWKMDFPKGVYKREHEEPYYLNRILNRQHLSFLMKSHGLDRPFTSVAADISRTASFFNQVTAPDWAVRSTSIASQYQDPIEAAYIAAKGQSLYDLEQYLGSSNLADQAAGIFPGSTNESVRRELANSESAYRAAMGSSFMSASEAAAGLTNNSPSLLDDEILASLKGSHTSIQDVIAPQYLHIPEPESKLPPVNVAPFKFIDDQSARLREEQRERDEWLKRQAENSEALLLAQRENDKKAEKDRREAKRATVIGLIIAGIGAIGSFIPF